MAVVFSKKFPDCGYPAYSQGDWLSKVAEATAIHLDASSSDATSWMDALEKYEGSSALPLMTIHKSKGLEYRTVIFVGLDDGAWWSFKRDQVEATAGFLLLSHEQGSVLSLRTVPPAVAAPTSKRSISYSLVHMFRL